jgi:hypothetical protein
VVADFERTKKMLNYFVKKAKTGGSNISIQAVMSIVSDVTHFEQRALMNAAEDAGIGKVFMMEEGLAAAFGAGVQSSDKRASAVVDIGAGTTNIAMIAKGAIVHSTSERYGSNSINEGIATHLRRHRGPVHGNCTQNLGMPRSGGGRTGRHRRIVPLHDGVTVACPQRGNDGGIREDLVADDLIRVEPPKTSLGKGNRRGGFATPEAARDTGNYHYVM